MQTGYLVPVVSQVDPEDTHAVEDKLHGGQEVIQHCRLQTMKVHRLSSWKGNKNSDKSLICHITPKKKHFF